MFRTSFLASSLTYLMILALMPVQSAFALADQELINIAEGNEIAVILCRALSWFNASYALPIAAFAVMVTGIGCLLGKVSWGIFISLALSILFLGSTGYIANKVIGTAAAMGNESYAAKAVVFDEDGNATPGKVSGDAYSVCACQGGASCSDEAGKSGEINSGIFHDYRGS